MIKGDSISLRTPQRAQDGRDPSSDGTGLSAGELAELTKGATVVHVVYAGTEYEGSWPVMGFERKQDAETFCALCVAHQEAKPRSPEYVHGEADDANAPEWDAWEAAHQTWCESHPAGLLGAGADKYVVGALDVLPAQQLFALNKAIAAAKPEGEPMSSTIEERGFQGPVASGTGPNMELAELDLAVARIEGMTSPTLWPGKNWSASVTVERHGSRYAYYPTSDHAEAMRLLEKYRLIVGPDGSAWSALHPDDHECDFMGHGPTPAIAIARAVVALRAKP